MSSRYIQHKAWTSKTVCWTNKADTKSYIVYDFIYSKVYNRQNLSLRRESARCLSWAGRCWLGRSVMGLPGRWTWSILLLGVGCTYAGVKPSSCTGRSVHYTFFHKVYIFNLKNAGVKKGLDSAGMVQD